MADTRPVRAWRSAPAGRCTAASSPRLTCAFHRTAAGRSLLLAPASARPDRLPRASGRVRFCLQSWRLSARSRSAGMASLTVLGPRTWPRSSRRDVPRDPSVFGALDLRRLAGCASSSRSRHVEPRRSRSLSDRRVFWSGVACGSRSHPESCARTTWLQPGKRPLPTAPKKQSVGI